MRRLLFALGILVLCASQAHAQITFTALDTQVDETGGGPYVTDAVTPSANALVLVGVYIAGMDGEPDTSVSVSGLGATWTRRLHFAPTNDFFEIPLWIFSGAGASGTGAITVTATGGSPWAGYVMAVEATGSSTPTVVANTDGDEASAASSLTLTLGALAHANNRVFAVAVQNGNTVPGSMVAGSNTTEIQNFTVFFGSALMGSYAGDANANVVSVNTGVTTGTWAGGGIEITEGGGGGGGSSSGGLSLRGVGK